MKTWPKARSTGHLKFSRCWKTGLLKLEATVLCRDKVVCTSSLSPSKSPSRRQCDGTQALARNEHCIIVNCNMTEKLLNNGICELPTTIDPKDLTFCSTITIAAQSFRMKESSHPLLVNTASLLRPEDLENS
jgi:hypothetical protein